MKTKFNIIDAIIALIIVIAIVICGFVFFKFANKDSVAVDNTTKINFIVEINNLTEESANNFKTAVGKTATFGPTASGRGIVSNVEIVPFKRWTKNINDGKIIITEVPNRYTANVTIESYVVKTDISYTSGSEVVAVGKEMPFNAKGAASENGYIINLYEVK